MEKKINNFTKKKDYTNDFKRTEEVNKAIDELFNEGYDEDKSKKIYEYLFELKDLKGKDNGINKWNSRSKKENGASSRY